MDVTGDTVSDASHIRNGYVGHLNDGTQVTGSYTGSSPSLQAKTNISPTTSSQTIQADSGYDGLSSVQINAMPSMTLPSASSASSSGTSKATITPTSSAQYLNIPTGYNDTAQYYTIAAASGGTSNMVTGTFKGTTTGVAMDVTLNYSGSGYPIALLIFPDAGATAGTFGSTVKRYAIQMFSVAKLKTDTAPAYANSTDDQDIATITIRYKNSTSSSGTYSQSSNISGTFNDTDSSGSQAVNTVKIRSKTSMSVFIAGSNYGFLANIDYRYVVLYSS